MTRNIISSGTAKVGNSIIIIYLVDTGSTILGMQMIKDQRGGDNILHKFLRKIMVLLSDNLFISITITILSCSLLFCLSVIANVDIGKFIYYINNK